MRLTITLLLLLVLGTTQAQQTIPVVRMPDESGFKPVKRTLPLPQKKPMPASKIRQEDVLFNHRIWREIDVRDPQNNIFRYVGEDPGSDRQFISILVDAVRTRQVTAFSSVDDRFTTPLRAPEFEKLFKIGCDTIPVYTISDPSVVDKYLVVCNSIRPDDIVRFRIKENWIYDKATRSMQTQIIGICPLKTVYGPDGNERGVIQMFWVFFPDLSPVLAQYEAFDPNKVVDNRLSWQSVFEKRMFSSVITKTTYGNPRLLSLEQLYPGEENKTVRLAEGEKIEQMFLNFGQELRSN